MKSTAGRPKIGKQVCTSVDATVLDHISAVREAHGFATAAAAMRHILIEATKRGIGLNKKAAPGS